MGWLSRCWRGAGRCWRPIGCRGTPYLYVIGEDGVILNAGFASTQEQLEALVTGGEVKGGGSME